MFRIKKKIKNRLIIALLAIGLCYVLVSFGATFNYFAKATFPNFVYRNISFEELGVPVILYHSVVPDKFETDLKYLKNNKYHTIIADELHGFLKDNKSLSNRAILLTFDDGLGSLWGVAYPLLKKYGMKATAFIIPGRIQDAPCYPNLEDYWAGRATLEEVVARGSEHPTVSWEEVKKMHNDGVIDFQSHTLNHAFIYISPKIIDFVSPDLPIYGFSTLIVRADGMDTFYRELGMPIYAYGPRMAAARRYFDDEGLRESCINYVKNNGGDSFLNDLTGKWPYVISWKPTNELKFLMIDMRQLRNKERQYPIVL